MNPLFLGLAAALFFLLRKKKPTTAPDNTTPAVVPFTAVNVDKYKNENTSGTFDSRLATTARRVTPDGTGKNIVDGTYKCFAPGNQSRRAAIIKVYEDLERLQTRINNSTGERKEEARKDRREKDDERAILVAEHYMLCEAFFEELKRKNATAPQTVITTAPQERILPQERIVPQERTVTQYRTANVPSYKTEPQEYIAPQERNARQEREAL